MVLDERGGPQAVVTGVRGSLPRAAETAGCRLVTSTSSALAGSHRRRQRVNLKTLIRVQGPTSAPGTMTR